VTHQTSWLESTGVACMVLKLCQAYSPGLSAASMLMLAVGFEQCNSSGLTLESQDGRWNFGAVQLSFFTRAEQSCSMNGSTVAVSASTPSRAK